MSALLFSHASAYFHPPPHQLPQPKKKAILLCIIYNPGFNKLKCYLVDEVSFISQFAGEMSHYRSELRCSTLSLSLFICFLCPRITFSATRLSKQRTKSKKLLKKNDKKGYLHNKTFALYILFNSRRIEVYIYVKIIFIICKYESIKSFINIKSIPDPRQ